MKLVLFIAAIVQLASMVTYESMNLPKSAPSESFVADNILLPLGCVSMILLILFSVLIYISK